MLMIFVKIPMARKFCRGGYGTLPELYLLARKILRIRSRGRRWPGYQVVGAGQREWPGPTETGIKAGVAEMVATAMAR
jgi:hypothetical protein